jgi:hypothetical protein
MDLPNPPAPPAVSKPWHQSKTFSLILKSIVALIAAMLIFQLGMFVGFRKASFSYAWGDNYHTVFGGPQGGLMHDFAGQDFMNGHGISGTVAQIDGNNIIIKGNSGMEMSITVTDKTSILKGRSQAGLADLQLDDMITAIGRPGNNGVIAAEIIRVLEPIPPPSGMHIPLLRNY